jgi:uncharacterized LabA/DUF88 family protein
MNEPPVKRTIAYIDGQNLFNSAKEAFGYSFPNYDIKSLVESVSSSKSWNIDSIRFYTGIPDESVDPARYHFWVAKLAAMGTRGIKTFSRKLKYSNQRIVLPDNSVTTALVGREKGIDIRIALDIVNGALNNEYDVALVFSQDQDLTEAVDEVKSIARRDSRWIKVACAFPVSPASRTKRGMNGTEWIKIDRAAYDHCIDPHDYRRRQ